MKGQVVSKGIAIGTVKRIEAYKPVGLIKTQDINGALELLEASKERTSNELKALVEKTRANVGDKEAQIFEAHLMILDDPTLQPSIEAVIKNDAFSAETVVEKVLSNMEEMFKNLESDYMKERALDIFDIKKRWVKNILRPDSILTESDQAVILYAEELTPSDTLDMDLSTVQGLLMEKGGVTSHTAILAQSMDIPAMVGCGPLDLDHGQLIILDANDGTVLSNYSEDTLSKYQVKREQELEEKEALKLYKECMGKTLDGKRVEIAANIAGLKDIESVHANGGEGVGLFRTEFVYMNRNTPPSEDEQYSIYKKIVVGLDGKPIIFRTMDIGGDKEVPYLNMPLEPNPFLGYRAIRYCLDEVAFFKTQIRAILRASIYGNLKIMFPMIGSIKQFLEAKEIVQACRDDLKAEGLDLKEIPIGIMIEIPSAAILAEQFAKYVDFFSIGTNDLTQYTLAVDRQNEAVGDLYDYFDPAVLSLIHHVIKVGKKTGTWVGMCGSAAGDPMMIPLLVSWGIDELSMSTSQILAAKKIVCNMTANEVKIDDFLLCHDAKYIRRRLKKMDF